MKEIYVKVVTTPEVMIWKPVGTFLEHLDLRQGWYRARWEGEEIIVDGFHSLTCPCRKHWLGLF